MSFVGYEEKRPGDLLKLIGTQKQQRATEAAEKSFYEFVKQAWDTVDPANPYQDSWHVGAISEHLTAVHLGQIRRLVINMPPGFAKSVLLCVMFPSWEWLIQPQHRYLCSSYSEEFAIRDALRARNLIESEWYQARWGSRFKIGGSDLQSTKMMYENDKTGYRISFGIKGGLGHRGSRIFCLPYDQEIETSSGPLPIGRIVEKRLPVLVRSYHHETGATEWRSIEEYEVSAGRPCLELETMDGSLFRCTTDHHVYVQSKGYIPASTVETGDSIIFHESTLRPLQETEIHLALASGKKRKRTCILQPSLLANIQHGKKQPGLGRWTRRSHLRGLQSQAVSKTVPGQTQQSKSLLKRVSGHIFLRAERTSSAWITATSMPDMRSPRSDQTSRPTPQTDVLRAQVRQYGSSPIHQREKQSTLRSRQIRRTVPCGFSRYGSRDQETRWGQVPTVRDLRNRERKGTGRPSYRLRQGQQRRRQYDFSLPDMSRSNARIPGQSSPVEIKLVKFVTYLTDTPERVYNVRVAVDHNYFASGFLVHNCDDPHKVKQAESDAEREDACSSYKSTMTTRANNIHTAAWVIIMQRLHERDLAGQMMELGYQCLKIPMRYDPTKPWKKILVDFRHVDPRTEFGQLLFPERLPEPEVALQELTFGSYMTSGQYQQEPSPADGGIYKRAWFCKYWCYPTDNLTAPTIRIGDKEIETELIKIDPKDLEEQGLSFDCTFKDVDDADFVVGQVWGRRRADRFLLDQVRKRMDFPATRDAVEAMALKWPRATAKYIEDKANGPAVISSLKHKIPGMIAVNPAGGKESRAQGVSPQYEAGNIWLPHPSIAPWVSAFIEEHIAFPNAAHDDCVDCASMILNQWLGGWLGYIEYLKRESAQEDAMKNRKEAIATGAHTVRCPACESMAVVQMSGTQGKRCSNCGHQFDRGASTYAPPKRGPEMRKQMR